MNYCLANVGSKCTTCPLSDRCLNKPWPSHKLKDHDSDSSKQLRGPKHVQTDSNIYCAKKCSIQTKPSTQNQLCNPELISDFGYWPAEINTVHFVRSSRGYEKLWQVILPVCVAQWRVRKQRVQELWWERYLLCTRAPRRIVSALGPWRKRQTKISQTKIGIGNKA